MTLCPLSVQQRYKVCNSGTGPFLIYLITVVLSFSVQLASDRTQHGGCNSTNPKLYSPLCLFQFVVLQLREKEKLLKIGTSNWIEESRSSSNTHLRTHMYYYYNSNSK